jgi:predicted nucleotidyltransferase component of viral defense system
MNLHLYPVVFNDLIILTSRKLNISVDYIRRDYFIVLVLKRLSESEFMDNCIFKGGTSLSKCYPGSIQRFSEDVDLTYIPINGESERQIEKKLKLIERLISVDCSDFEKISEERNQRNKSSFLYFKTSRIKIEIGSNIRPDPYELKSLKSYIQEFLELEMRNDIMLEYDMRDISVQTLRIERTFLDKVFAIKRHAICGSIVSKTRHLYDVNQLMKMEAIQTFIEARTELKRLIQITKKTDHFYFEKRGDNYELSPLSRTRIKKTDN